MPRTPIPRPDRRWLRRDGTPLDEEDRGLVYDVETLLSRRRALGLFGGLGVGALVAGLRRRDLVHVVLDLVGLLVICEHVGRQRPHRGAGRDRRPLPGRRLQRRRTCSTTPASSAATSAPASARSAATADGVPLTVRADGRATPPTAASAVAGAAVYVWHCDRDGRLLAVLHGARATRTTCAASRPPTRRHRRPSPAIFPGGYPGAGRTSTSRSTTSVAERHRRRPDREDLADRAARGDLRGRSTPPTATSRASATWPRPRSPPTWSSATTAASTSSPRCPAPWSSGVRGRAHHRRLSRPRASLGGMSATGTSGPGSSTGRPSATASRRRGSTGSTPPAPRARCRCPGTATSPRPLLREWVEAPRRATARDGGPWWSAAGSAPTRSTSRRGASRPPGSTSPRPPYAWRGSGTRAPRSTTASRDLLALPEQWRAGVRPGRRGVHDPGAPRAAAGRRDAGRRRARRAGRHAAGGRVPARRRRGRARPGRRSR